MSKALKLANKVAALASKKARDPYEPVSDEVEVYDPEAQVAPKAKAVPAPEAGLDEYEPPAKLVQGRSFDRHGNDVQGSTDMDASLRRRARADIVKTFKGK